MPELSPYTNEAIDAAWQDALDANDAYTDHARNILKQYLEELESVPPDLSKEN